MEIGQMVSEIFRGEDDPCIYLLTWLYIELIHVYGLEHSK